MSINCNIFEKITFKKLFVLGDYLSNKLGFIAFQIILNIEIFTVSDIVR